MRSQATRSWQSVVLVSLGMALTAACFSACGTPSKESAFTTPDPDKDEAGVIGDATVAVDDASTPVLINNDKDSGTSTPGNCKPRTCAEASVTCGPLGDGCGGVLDCGTCVAPQTCGGGGTYSACGGTAGCVPTTCAAVGATCGPIGDGCGGVVQCGTCTLPEVCGGGGNYSVCGGGAPVTDGGPCVPKTCASVGATCGSVADGCGGLTPSCGTCSGTQICGGGGTPSTCGGVAACVPRTCAQAGANCGPEGDGCGGLLANCGTCTAPNICGGAGVLSQCGNSSGGDSGACTNLCTQQTTCSGGKTTTLTGTVFDPAGLNPLYGAFVYVPNAPVAPFTPGVSCDQCGAPASGSPLVTATTGPDGKFTLTNVPAGSNIPVVIQIGRWRRQIKVNVTACTTAAIPAASTHMPRNKSEGDIPKMAISTGESDPFECLLLKMGIDAAEFTPNTGTGRIHYYTGNGVDLKPAAPPGSALWSSLSTLKNYDIVYLPCEAEPTDHGDAARTNLLNYSAAGGRIFTTHYSYEWIQPLWPTVGKWDLDQTPLEDITAKINTTFPKGLAYAQWLQNVGATTTLGTIKLQDTKHDLDTVNATLAQNWISLSNAASGNSSSIQQMTFNTPINASVNDAGASLACGKVVFSDFHVSTAALSDEPNFPASCLTGALASQEKALEFMIFDLSSCVQTNVPPPPPTCTKTTCAAAGVNCGPIGDGCGGELQCGTCTLPSTCGGGGTPGQCGGPTCTPTTCMAANATCGLIGNGCGGTIDCGTCGAGENCGGGGSPNTCGNASCTGRTCAQANASCGPAADGCGGLLDCGPCVLPDTCGGGGTPSQCGHPTCRPQTCDAAGVTCGSLPDGCGALLQCGTCVAPETCGGGGTPNHCGGGPK